MTGWFALNKLFHIECLVVVESEFYRTVTHLQHLKDLESFPLFEQALTLLWPVLYKIKIQLQQWRLTSMCGRADNDKHCR